MRLGLRIARRLKEIELTQVQIGEQTGLTQQAISRYIRDRSKPSYEAVMKLSQALQVPPGWFYPENEFNDPSAQSALQEQVPSPVNADIIAFPTTGRFAQGTRFVIGHYLPMHQFPGPSQAGYEGVNNNFYALIFNTLAERALDGTPRGFLAIDWKQVDASWLFRLRSGVRFHDGTPMMADDVAWSYDQYLQANPKERWIENIEIVDENVVQLQLKAPRRLEDLVMPRIMPEGMKASPDQWIGTGPFRVEALEPGFWRLRSNPHYFFGTPYFDEIHIREYPDPQALTEALVSGEVHFAIGVNVPGENFRGKQDSAVRRYHLHFILKEPLAANFALRKVIALALDKEAIANAAGFKQPLFSSGPFDYVLSDRLHQPPLPPDPQTAKSLLKRLKGLEDSVFRVKCYRPREQPMAVEIVRQLNQVGVRAQLVESDEPADALLVVRNTRTFEQEHLLWSTESRHNLSGYSNPAVDRLIQQCIEEPTNLTYLRQLRRLIQQDLPDIPLFYDEMPVTYVKQLGALENRVVLLSNLNEIHTWYLARREMSEERRAQVAY